MPRAQRAKSKPQPALSEEIVSAKHNGLFGALGLQGLEALAPVLVAALATEEPLLLIGPHGTAKTLLLTRVASALGLTTRHYNASLLNFDDLVGFPLPGKNGELEYVKTPAAIWGAGAVIFDEISRCRPDIQNKLFPIIHERRSHLVSHGLLAPVISRDLPPYEVGRLRVRLTAKVLHEEAAAEYL
jgi:MoxR-like ATPase